MVYHGFLGLYHGFTVVYHGFIRVYPLVHCDLLWVCSGLPSLTWFYSVSIIVLPLFSGVTILFLVLP
jgi:hypothetical protein